MSEQVAAEQTFDGQKLRPRKKKTDKKTPKKRTAQQSAVAAKSAEVLAEVSDVLDDEVPSVIVVTIEDEEREVNIYKCKARQIGHVMKFLASAFKSMGANTFDDASEMAANMQNPSILLTMLGDLMDEAIITSCMLTDIDSETFKDLALDDALAVMLGVCMVNQSFFLARVLPMITGVMNRKAPDTKA